MTSAVLDANVLYSAMLRDLFMRLAVSLVFQPKWTERMAPYGIRALHPDDFLLELLDAVPDAFLTALRNHRAALKNPSSTPEEYLARFVDKGLTKTAVWLERYKNQI